MQKILRHMLFITAFLLQLDFSFSNKTDDKLESFFGFFGSLNWSSNLKNTLKNDIQESSALISLFDIEDVQKQIDLAEAWKLIHESIPLQNGTTQFAKDLNTLNKITEIMQDGSVFRNALGGSWSSKLTEILQKHKHLRCSTCDGVFDAAPPMHEFLADVEHFYGNFSTNGKGSKYFNWLNRQTAGAGDVADIATNNANTSLAEMYHTIHELRIRGLAETDVSQFGASYSALPNSRQSDILLNDGKHIELKNKKYTVGSTPTEQEIDQVIGVKGAFGNIDNLNKFEWVAFASRGNDIAEVKTMWKNVFESRTADIFETIWGNQNLRNDLFGANITKVDAELDFTDLINSTSSKLYDFIKVQ